MSRSAMNRIIRTAVLAFGLSAIGVCFAHGGGGGWHGGGGGWHGGGGGWHGGGGGWHGGGGGWHGGGYYHGGGWGGGWGGTGVVIGVPDEQVYAPACNTVRVCNSYGHCWLQESCY